MFKTKFIISLSIFVIFLTITSIIKNETRLFEKEIFNLNKKISIKKKILMKLNWNITICLHLKK